MHVLTSLLLGTGKCLVAFWSCFANLSLNDLVSEIANFNILIFLWHGKIII